MSVENQILELFGKPVFERAHLQTPFKKKLEMNNQACFLYVRQGCCQSFAQDVEVKAQAQEAILMKSGTYSGRFLGNEPYQNYRAIAIHFYPEVLQKVYEYELPPLLKSKGAEGQSMVKLAHSAALTGYIENLLFYFDNPRKAHNEALAALLKELVTMLEQQIPQNPELQPILSELFSPVSYSFQEMVAAHLYTNITVQELAQLAGLSESSVKREFKKIYQHSPASYLRQQKLLRAENLLLSSGCNIRQVTHECGFKDIAHFSKLFKQTYGVSPSAYRAEHLVDS